MDWVQWLGLGGGLAAVATFVWGRRDASRADAASVHVMVTVFQPAPPPPDAVVFTRFQIFNNGSLPALSVSVDAWTWGRRRATWRFRRFAQLMTGERIVGRVYNTVRPNSETPEDELPGVVDPGPLGVNPPLMLRFCDGHGRRWIRWPDGKLTRLTPSLVRVEHVWQRRKERARQAERRRLVDGARRPAGPHAEPPPGQ